MSILSGGLGIAKFLKGGPCKVLPETSGFLGGFVSLGLPAVVLSIIATILGKGFMLPIAAYNSENYGFGLRFADIAMWIGFNWIPSLIYVSQYSIGQWLNFWESFLITGDC